MRREQKFWGWGEPGAGPALPDHAAGAAARRGSASPAPSSRRRSGSTTSGCRRRPRRRRCARRSSGSSGRSTCATTPGRACCGRRASRTWTCWRCARASASGRPTWWSRPARTREVQALLHACAEGGAAVIPFGGGTSVVGGVAPRARALGHARSRSISARLDARARRRRPLAHAHACRRAGGCRSSTTRSPRTGCGSATCPQSYEWATVGGCAATRSAGQASSGVGRFDELVAAVRCATPSGRAQRRSARRRAQPARTFASSCSARRGRLGVITELSAARPAARRGAALRGVAAALVRGRRRDAARARPGGRGAGCRAAVRRGRDPHHACARRRGRRGPPRRGRRAARAGVPPGMPARRRMGGRPGRRRAAALARRRR